MNQGIQVIDANQQNYNHKPINLIAKNIYDANY